jgi:hypothetical protein
MRGVQINLKAWFMLAAVLALLWLAVEQDTALAGVAVDNIFGWGLLGFTVWVVLAQGVGRRIKRIVKGRAHG